jgi:hypothetical protein
VALDAFDHLARCQETRLLGGENDSGREGKPYRSKDQLLMLRHRHFKV